MQAESPPGLATTRKTELTNSGRVTADGPWQDCDGAKFEHLRFTLRLLPPQQPTCNYRLSTLHSQTIFNTTHKAFSPTTRSQKYHKRTRLCQLKSKISRHLVSLPLLSPTCGATTTTTTTRALALATILHHNSDVNHASDNVMIICSGLETNGPCLRHSLAYR